MIGVMAITTRTDRVVVDGGEFDLHLSLPEGGSGPGIVLLQEIFGVGTYIRQRAADLAALGYVVGAPDLFWRLEPNFVAEHDEAGLQTSFAMMGRFDFAVGTADCVAALRHLQALPGTGGQVATMGFCLGGGLAFLAAADGDPACCVSYYGSAVAPNIERAADVTCPILFHFGGADPYLPAEQVEVVQAAFAGRVDAEVVVQAGAGHAFDNFAAPMFTNPSAAAAAWPVTVDFLHRHLPVGSRG